MRPLTPKSASTASSMRAFSSSASSDSVWVSLTGGGSANRPSAGSWYSPEARFSAGCLSAFAAGRALRVIALDPAFLAFRQPRGGDGSARGAALSSRVQMIGALVVILDIRGRLRLHRDGHSASPKSGFSIRPASQTRRPEFACTPRTMGMKRRPVARKASGRPTSRRPSGNAQLSQGVCQTCAAWAERPCGGDADQPAGAGGQTGGRGNSAQTRGNRHGAQRPGQQPPHGIFAATCRAARARPTRTAAPGTPAPPGRRSAAAGRRPTAPSGPSQLETSRRLALFRLASSAGIADQRQQAPRAPPRAAPGPRRAGPACAAAGSCARRASARASLMAPPRARG